MDLCIYWHFYALGDFASYRAKQRDGWTADMISDLVFYGA
jgi:phosphatidylglycerol:prolipoprotein diacylglycerol transferase